MHVFRLDHLRCLSSVGLALLLSACAGLASKPAVTDTPATQQPQQAITQGSFEAATLYALLVAEIAAQRDMPQITLHNYVQEAERTRDINIVRHASRLAERYRDPNSRLKTALIWAELEPENPEPNNIAAAELIRRGETDKALPRLQASLANNSFTTIDALSERAQKMSSTERNIYLTMLDQLLAPNPDQAKLLYTKASLLRFETDLAPALRLIQKTLKLAPQFDRAILLEADLQARDGHLDTALGHLREELNRRNHKQMRTLYTRLLLQKGLFDAAGQQANLLTERHPNDHNLRFYLGALMLEHNQIEQSEKRFRQLAQQFGTNSTLHYYLGRIAQIKKLPDEALSHYQQIGDSPYLMAGMSEVARLLDQPDDELKLRQIYQDRRGKHPSQSSTLFIMEASWLSEQDRQQQALQVYTEALEQHPSNPQLLYNRAMLNEQLNELAEMEQDLRQLLKQQPDNATALNALGYSLTDHTDRHQEALVLIRQALKLKPEDPAILDSMGWVHYKLGDYPLALEYLLRAFDSFPDAEIASHLGQVYWKLGQTDRARQIWNTALERNPDSPLLLEAMRQAGLTQ